MRYASVTDRLSGLGGAKWEVHARARRLKAEGRDVIELTIGEPDVPTPPQLMEVAARSMQQGRTGYSNGRGEPGLLRPGRPLHGAARAAHRHRSDHVLSRHPDHAVCRTARAGAGG
jgi:arginine:pyruvate transaminase